MTSLNAYRLRATLNIFFVPVKQIHSINHFFVCNRLLAIFWTPRNPSGLQKRAVNAGFQCQGQMNFVPIRLPVKSRFFNDRSTPFPLSAKASLTTDLWKGTAGVRYQINRPKPTLLFLPWGRYA